MHKDRQLVVSKKTPTKKRQLQRGFTLIEVLVAAAISVISIVASMAALGSTAKIETREEQSQFLQTLAHREYSEILATEDLSQGSQSGDFQEQNLPDYSWTMTLTPTPTTNMDEMTVTVTDSADSTQQVVISGLVYVPAATTSGTPTAATGTGGGTGGL